MPRARAQAAEHVTASPALSSGTGTRNDPFVVKSAICPYNRKTTLEIEGILRTMYDPRNSLTGEARTLLLLLILSFNFKTKKIGQCNILS